MTFQSFRILPLLIFVAMLAFSIRFVDFAVGAYTLAGTAYAAAAEEPKAAVKAASPKEVTAPEPDQSALSGSMDADKKGALQFPESNPDKSGPQPKDEGEAIGWQAPTDMDVDFSKTRKDLSEDLAQRREDLNRREKELQTKEALLKAGEQELDRKFQELSSLKKEIEGLLEKQSTEEDARVASLVKIYEGMKPADAARIFDSLDLDVLMSVMSRMSERKLSPVMAAMNPDRAKTITIMLAQQKQLPQLPAIQ